MKGTIDYDEILRQIPLENVVRHYNGGIVKGTGGSFRARCPFCLGKSSKGGRDEKWSMAIFATQNHIQIYKCMRASCNATGNALSMIKQLEGLEGESFEEIYEVAKEFMLSDYELPKPDPREKQVQLDKVRYFWERARARNDSPKINEYLKRRCINDLVIEEIKNDVGYDEDNNCIVFPIKDMEGNIVAIHSIKIEEGEVFEHTGTNKSNYGEIGKGFYWSGIPKDQLFPNIILVEGAIDALTVASVCPQYCVVAAIGTGYTKIRELFDRKTLRKLIVCFDNDVENKAGVTATRKAAKECRKLKCVNYDLFTDEDNITYNDLNDILMAGKEDMIIDILKKPKTIFGITVQLEEENVIYYDGDKLKINSHSLAKLLVRDLYLKSLGDGYYYIYTGKWYEKITEEKLFSMVADLLSLDTYKSMLKPGIRNEIKNYLSDESYITLEEIEVSSKYLTLQNCLFDLETGETYSFSPEIFTTNPLPFEYDSTATGKYWKIYLKSLFPKEPEMRTYLQELVGYSLYRGMPRPFMVFIKGARGTGKSTFLDIIGKLVGEHNSTSIPLEKINDVHNIARLYGKLINTAGETESDKTLSTQILKSITAGDPIEGRELYKSSFRFSPYVKIYVGMNEWPNIVDRTHALFDRIYPVVFERQFRGSGNEIIDLSRKLEIELPAIFLWAVEGLKRLQQNKWVFSIPESMMQIKDETKRISDSLYSFLCECTMDEDGSHLHIGELYDTYQSYMSINHPEQKKDMVSRYNFRSRIEYYEMKTKRLKEGGWHLMNRRYTEESQEYR